MEDGWIERIKLKNGLTLEMFDHSKHVAGDRWLVSFEAKMDVVLKPVYFADCNASETPFEDILALLGEEVTYRHKKERNFIDEKAKDEVLNRLCEQFLDTGLVYLSSPEFPRRLILKKYQETLSQQQFHLKRKQHAALLGE